MGKSRPLMLAVSLPPVCYSTAPVWHLPASTAPLCIILCFLTPVSSGTADAIHVWNVRFVCTGSVSYVLLPHKFPVQTESFRQSLADVTRDL